MAQEVDDPPECPFAGHPAAVSSVEFLERECFLAVLTLLGSVEHLVHGVHQVIASGLELRLRALSDLYKVVHEDVGVVHRPGEHSVGGRLSSFGGG